jgi:hypothetical protein
MFRNNSTQTSNHENAHDARLDICIAPARDAMLHYSTLRAGDAEKENKENKDSNSEQGTQPANLTL